MERLKEKVALVTGGCSGIGAAISELFVQEGAKVIVFDLIEKEVVKRCNLDFFKLNIGDEKAIKEAVNNIIAKYGRIDILVNNAGIPGANKPTHVLSEEEWDEVFDVDVKGTFFCCKNIIPHMINNGGGSIVNLCSVFGTHGSQGEISAYHAAKGAIMAMSKQDAATYGKKGIRVNAIFPGTIRTPLMENLTKEYPGGFDSYAYYIAKRNPLHKIGEPMDVAYGALYLASDEAKFVTGASLYIDGGYTVW